MRFTVLACLALTACVETTPTSDPVPPANPASNECGAVNFQNLIGQPANILSKMTTPANMRIIRPGTVVTEDYSAQRLNVDLNDGDQITRFWCG